MDLNWYDDRIVNGEIEVSLPSIIKVGQYYQWNCGKKICSIKQTYMKFI